MPIETLKSLRPLLVWQLDGLRITASTSWVSFEMFGERTTVRGLPDLEALRTNLATLLGKKHTVELAPGIWGRHTSPEGLLMLVRGDKDLTFADPILDPSGLEDLAEWLGLLAGDVEMPLGTNYLGLSDNRGSIEIRVQGGRFVINSTQREKLAHQILAVLAGGEDNSDPCREGSRPVRVISQRLRPSIHLGLATTTLSRGALAHLAASLLADKETA